MLDRLRTWVLAGQPAGIEQRLFRTLTLVSGILALTVVVPVNRLQGLPLAVDFWVGAFGLACLGLHAAARRGRYAMRSLFFLFMATLDAIWFPNGASLGSIGLYSFPAVCYLAIYFRGWQRWGAFGAFLANGLAMLQLEHRAPHLATDFPSRGARLLDLSAGFTLCSIMCVLILMGILNAYLEERRQLKEALQARQESEERFRSLVAQAPIPICITGESGRVEFVNHQFERVLGYRLEDLQGDEGWWRLGFPEPERRAEAKAVWREACQTAAVSDGIVRPREFPVTCRDGRQADMEIHAAYAAGRWMVMFKDVTDQRRSEAALRQAQKLESLGVLAGGIAHDFNNLLSAMLGNLNLAQLKLVPGSASGPYLENLEGAITRAAELTRQMLAYSGKGRFLVAPMDLNRLVTELLHLLSVSVTKRAQLTYDLAPGLPAIEADLAQVQQVVMNLVTNASEAISDTEGRISLATSLRRLDAAELQRDFPGQELAPGDYVCLSVGDTGCGMDADTLARIFDPFFSTKGTGRGLGLSAMLGILRVHQAGIQIQSAPGRGSTFQVLFPASDQSAAQPDGAGPRGQGRFQGRALVVDDEADLRFSFSSMLQQLGFQVVSARDGQEALDRFSRGGFDLVLMDLTMPRMGGQDAFLSMKAQDPEVKVVLVSGYNEREACGGLAGLQPAAFLQKPFSLQHLVATLDRVMA